MKTLLNNVSTDTTGAGVYMKYRGNAKGVLQVEVTGTVTVSVQGRVSDSGSWVELASLTVNAVQEITLAPEMRAVTSGMVGATASVWIAE